uniref:STAS domain-containing protein n=1 Tax=Rhabditophanes sp. KR3021 TaxID=114890 RepID=A0AC35UEY2_9BILA
MFRGKPIRGFLLDITGVLYNSSDDGGQVIQGSIEAIQRLYNESNVRFISNESVHTRENLWKKLTRLGFDINPEHLFTPAPFAADIVRTNNLRPFLLVHKNVLPEFDHLETTNPNCVVLGDAQDSFTFQNMNRAFKILMMNDNILFSMGSAQYYQRTDGPSLDVGAYAALFKSATNCKEVIIGKPNEDFFMKGVHDMGLQKSEVVMIGDDILGDVKGAQECGILGMQVMTGKWQAEWRNHNLVRPDFIGLNLKDIVDTILDGKMA